MKTFINKTGSIFILLTLLVSCSMDRYPLTDFGEDEFFTSEENARLAVIGLYRGDIKFNDPEYTPEDWWGYGANVLLDGVTDIGYDRRGFTNPIGQITSGGILSNNNNVGPLYKRPYRRISACNRFLENIDRLGSSGEVIRMKAEARFIRATSYFYLASYFHDVPLVKTVLTADESNNVKKSTRAEVIQYVIEELKEISGQLPRHKDLPATELGRATSQAALVFLARTYMLNKDYKEAASVCETIIGWGDNQLYDNYQTLFYPGGKSSSEHIFAIHLVDNLAGHALPQHAYPIKDAGWCLVNGSSHLYEAYEFQDGTPFSYDDPRFNIDNLGENRDPRLGYTLIYNNSTFRNSTYVCHPENATVDKIGAGQATQTGYLLRKYFDETWTGDLNRYGGITPVARYAEVLLMYLEAELEAGTAITQTLLNNTINAVRDRVNMPPVTDTDPAILREKIRQERMIELAFEGHRLWDLFRWGIAVEKLNAPIYGSPFYVQDENVMNKRNGETDPYSRWYVNTREFRAGQEVWPIPQDEQNINPNLR